MQNFRPLEGEILVFLFEKISWDVNRKSKVKIKGTTYILNKTKIILLVLIITHAIIHSCGLYKIKKLLCKPNNLTCVDIKNSSVI